MPAEWVQPSCTQRCCRRGNARRWIVLPAREAGKVRHGLRAAERIGPPILCRRLRLREGLASDASDALS